MWIDLLPVDLASLKFLSLGCMALNGDDRRRNGIESNTLVMKGEWSEKMTSRPSFVDSVEW